MATTLIDIFETRCAVRALLWREYFMDLQEAVDELQASAEREGLVQSIGQDAVQQTMSAAFRRWRDEC